MKEVAFVENTFGLRRLKHEVLYPYHWLRFMMLPAAERKALLGHADRVLESPDYARIIKHADSGRMRRLRLVMHNGLKVLPTAYYGYQFLARARITSTVDEPQEERLFADLLPQLPSGSVMLELGAYWAFYSLWFHAVVPNARNYMVEPELRNLSYGRTNFEINGFNKNATFVNAFVDSQPGQHERRPVVSVDSFCSTHGIETLAVLHADIQGYESRMLDGARGMLSEQRVDYIFISTHSNELHADCLKKLASHGYDIVSEINLEEAYQADGVIFAARAGLPPAKISPAVKRTASAKEAAS